MNTALAAKRAGQEQSLLDILDEQEGDFLHVIDQVTPGTLFSVNLIRSRLDAENVPDKARAGLFRRATAHELIVAVTVEVAGRVVPVTEPSTGPSAHAAHVRVYARTQVPLR